MSWFRKISDILRFSNYFFLYLKAIIRSVIATADTINCESPFNVIELLTIPKIKHERRNVCIFKWKKKMKQRKFLYSLFCIRKYSQHKNKNMNI